VYLSLRHILLLTGMASTILSFLFYGRNMTTYDILLLVGIVLSLISFVAVIIKDDSKRKILWILIVIIGIAIQHLTEQWLIKQSFKIFVSRNEQILNAVNKIFISKPPGLAVLANSLDKSKFFSLDEKRDINKLFNNTSVYIVSSDSLSVYYGTFGFLDVRIGVRYFYTYNVPHKSLHHIFDKWYY
jgi:hypothetical protein